MRVKAREFTSIGTITIRNRKTGQFLFSAGLPEQTEATLMMTNRDKEMNGVWTNDQFQMQYFSKGYRIKSVAHQGYIYSNCPGTFLRVIKNSAPRFGEFLLEFGDYTPGRVLPDQARVEREIYHIRRGTRLGDVDGGG